MNKHVFFVFYKLFFGIQAFQTCLYMSFLKKIIIKKIKNNYIINITAKNT